MDHLPLTNAVGFFKKNNPKTKKTKYFSQTKTETIQQFSNYFDWKMVDYFPLCFFLVLAWLIVSLSYV